jgi:uncharacterized SAM-binding protein YcdF (DUF218 family)
MLFFNKMLPVFVLPIGMVSALVLFALWRKKWWPGLLALGLLYVCSTPLLGERLFGWLESRYPVIPLDKVEQADAVYMLGGILGPGTDPGNQPNWSDTMERFEAGLALLQSGRARHLVFSGAGEPGQKDAYTEGHELKRRAILRGVPEGQIIITPLVQNTADEARAMAALMKEKEWQRVIVVTSGWHMPRAALLFRRASVNAVFFPVDFRARRPGAVSLMDFVPTGWAWAMTETAIRESYGYLFYRIFR